MRKVAEDFSASEKIAPVWRLARASWTERTLYVFRGSSWARIRGRYQPNRVRRAVRGHLEVVGAGFQVSGQRRNNLNVAEIATDREHLAPQRDRRLAGDRCVGGHGVVGLSATRTVERYRVKVGVRTGVGDTGPSPPAPDLIRPQFRAGADGFLSPPKIC